MLATEHSSWLQMHCAGWRVLANGLSSFPLYRPLQPVQFWCLLTSCRVPVEQQGLAFPLHLACVGLARGLCLMQNSPGLSLGPIDHLWWDKGPVCGV